MLTPKTEAANTGTILDSTCLYIFGNPSLCSLCALCLITCVGFSVSGLGDVRRLRVKQARKLLDRAHDGDASGMPQAAE